MSKGKAAMTLRRGNSEGAVEVVEYTGKILPGSRTQKEVREEFDKLSEKIMEEYDFKTPEEMEHFMRREEIDPR